LIFPSREPSFLNQLLKEVTKTLNGDTVDRVKTEETESRNGRVQKMPKKKKVKVKTYKRRAKGRVRKTVTVRGHHRSLPKPPKRRRRRR